MTNTTTRTAVETDAMIIERLRERFQILEDMTKAVKMGQVRALLVSGSPGCGKSFGVEKVLSRYNVLGDIAQDATLRKYDFVKGALSPLGLYCKLFAYKDKRDILVFDDSDSAFEDPLSLNILKAALDTSRVRRISWNTDSRLLRQEEIPDSFEFNGGAIFITNVDFKHIKSKKLQDHLAAIESRCHFIDLTVHTQREKMLRIRQIAADGLFNGYDFSQEEQDEIVMFINNNRDHFRELSLRSCIKTADLKKAFPERWQSVAAVTLMR